MRESMLRDDLRYGEYAVAVRPVRGLSFDGPEPGAEGVVGCGVEKGDPGMELARRISSDMGRLLLRGAISYRAYSGGLMSPPVVLVDLGMMFGLGVEYVGLEETGRTFSWIAFNV